MINSIHFIPYACFESSADPASAGGLPPSSSSLLLSYSFDYAACLGPGPCWTTHLIDYAMPAPRWVHPSSPHQCFYCTFRSMGYTPARIGCPPIRIILCRRGADSSGGSAWGRRGSRHPARTSSDIWSYAWHPHSELPLPLYHRIAAISPPLFFDPDHSPSWIEHPRWDPPLD